jgi:hypothetical protein
MGLLAVTNFHGFAEKFARQAEASRAQRRRLQRLNWTGEGPPNLAGKTRQMRLLAPNAPTS